MESLAVKWRPKTWEEVTDQKIVIEILKKQIETQQLKNAYLFSGASGCGKTTLARIFAMRINQDQGEPIEIDAASNNGVDNIKSLVKSAQERSISSKYKIYIIDECHALTNQSWQALLKCIEEPPQYTIFIFCTTDPQKIPDTILNRVQRFNISKISYTGIVSRLSHICKCENFVNYDESVNYISKIASGGMRDAIALLDKCSSYSTDLCLENVLKVLGNFSYDIFFKLINNMIDGNESEVLSIVDNFYYSGADLKIFIDNFLQFCLDVLKYILFKSFNNIKIPPTQKDALERTIAINDNKKYFHYFVDKLLETKNMIKTDEDIYSTIQVMLLKTTRLA